METENNEIFDRFSGALVSRQYVKINKTNQNEAIPIRMSRSIKYSEVARKIKTTLNRVVVKRKEVIRRQFQAMG